MTTRGTLAANALKLAQLKIDFLQNPVRIEIIAGLVNEDTGDTIGWTQADGGAISNETKKLLKELMESIENDVAARVFVEGGASSSTVQRGTPGMAGLGEHVGGAEEAASI